MILFVFEGVKPGQTKSAVNELTSLKGRVVPRLYRGCTKVVPRLYQDCTKVVPRLYQGLRPGLFENLRHS